MARSLDEDPLTLAIAPPPDETYEQRQIREAAEAEAKRISDEIDEQIRKDREAERRKKKPVKLLLLGAFSLYFSEIALRCIFIVKARAKAGKRRR